MNKTLDIKIPLRYSDIFEDEPLELKDYFNNINKNIALKLILLLLNKSEFEDWRYFIKAFFCFDNSEIAFDFYNRIEILSLKKKVNFYIISVPSLLKSFEFTFDNLNEKAENVEEQNITELNLFKAFLVFNEIDNFIFDKALKSTEYFTGNEKAVRIILTSTFPHADLLNIEYNELIISQFFKSILLFEFFENDFKSQVLYSMFLKTFNCVSWKEYAQHFWSVVFPLINNKLEGNFGFYIPKDEHYKERMDFFSKFDISSKSKISSPDFKTIREFPLINMGGDFFHVINFPFFIECVHKGVFFKLSQINNNLPKANKFKQDFRGFYCDEFSENILLYKVLKYIYQNKFVQFSGSEMKKKGMVGEPDYYIRNDNKIFLFENKDVWIKGETKESFDYMEYEEELAKKFYYCISEKGKVEKKAVLQLIENIKLILINQFFIDKLNSTIKCEKII